MPGLTQVLNDINRYQQKSRRAENDVKLSSFGMTSFWFCCWVLALGRVNSELYKQLLCIEVALKIKNNPRRSPHTGQAYFDVFNRELTF